MPYIITHKEFLEAQEIVKKYNLQMKSAVFKPADLKIDMPVRRYYPQSMVYWVTEIKGEDVLIRTTFDESDKNYDDFWVSIAELRPEKQ